MNQIVLMYHDVYRDTPAESGFQTPMSMKYKVSALQFESHVAAVDRWLKVHDLPKDLVDFTFDDGGVSFLVSAAPILEKYGFRGKFYISTEYIGSKGFLDTKQIKELANRGHIIGNHSHSHPKIMTSLDRNSIRDEWKFSQLILSKVLGDIPKHASIPNGYSSDIVLREMFSTGIRYIDNSSPTTSVKNYRNAQIRGRYAVTNEMSERDVIEIVSSSLYRFKKLIYWRFLSFAKCILGDKYLILRRKIVNIFKL